MLRSKLNKIIYIIAKYRLNIRTNFRVGTNGLPVPLYIEMLLVTDCTIYADHQRYANTNNKDLVFLYMRIYFAHVFMAV